MALMSGGQRASRSQSSCGAHYLSGTNCYRLLLVELIRAGCSLPVWPAAVALGSLLWDVLVINTMHLYRL